MYKSQYTPAEAQDQFQLIDDSSHPEHYKERFRRYVQNRVVETPEGIEQ